MAFWFLGNVKEIYKKVKVVRTSFFNCSFDLLVHKSFKYKPTTKDGIRPSRLEGRHSPSRKKDNIAWARYAIVRARL